jgi:choline kinase
MARVIGIVLAAGAGRRLHPLTYALPKTLLEVSDDRTILDVALANLASVGVRDVVLVTGFAADVVEGRRRDLEDRHGVRIETVFNERALEWNNAYSLWLAREWFTQGVVLCNGDTVHPPVVEDTLLASRGPEILLAIDDVKSLADEEMKVIVKDGRVTRITKQMAPSSAAGEYIGVAVLEPAASASLAQALEDTWQANPDLYYEDGFQLFADRGGNIGVAPIGAQPWVEVDNHDDLARAREIACRY